ncbi:MAG: hydrogenase expression protein [Synergistaceae bacterium]|jgi:hydrogenase maturation factor|nr:hydrogenase expression protein [Synergistaceae bacterium]
MMDCVVRRSENPTGPSGKLSPEALARSVLVHSGAVRPEVIVGPAVGEDAAVIKWPPGKLMVLASDPIVGALKGAGRLLVRVNVNDIASKGGEPAYIVVTMILPPVMGEEAVSSIMREIHDECERNGIAIVGGHTEFNDLYTRPVLSAALVGTADRVFSASDITEGDVLLVTKHIGIEGMAILASDRPDLLKGILSDGETAEVGCWMDNTSVLPESRLLRRYASFMHDPTEGGFLGGLGEICRLCGLRAEVEVESVPVHDYTRKASSALGFDPLRLVASGSLMATVPEGSADEALAMLRDDGIPVTRVGRLIRGNGRRDEGEAAENFEELWPLLKRKAGGHNHG